LGGANIVTVTDYELSGVDLASKWGEDIPWIMMDDNTIEYFGLQKENTMVVNATNKKLLEHVQELIEEDARFA